MATPIGNLEDWSPRARTALAAANRIVAEDTRHTRKLLAHFDIHVPLVSCHAHNEAQKVPVLVDCLVRGERLALVTDAGTPLVSDPGTKTRRCGPPGRNPGLTDTGTGSRDRGTLRGGVPREPVSL
ncbi:Uroporphyrin-III C/tetrapyrrole (Corrin/Porphyrin) methyltransferase [mine drainage metagenome]|uniref:Uroporphyrin-III C/tetrapyrrole (Corrin/Porphyrin) methyltransferase n=1 Tax=mine drainage metagenome TaxID=410659 RepID=T0ZH38_9ZZZZ